LALTSARFGFFGPHVRTRIDHMDFLYIFRGGDRGLADGGRVVAGTSKQVTDGPYGETQDLVGGYVLVHAATIEIATELARGCPILQAGGSVEVREVRPMSP
jgi:hypothetical protein